MKKTLYTILALAAVVSLSSCEKWLEATSSTKIPADKLFETRGGFCDALSGAYISMSSAHLYGGTMGFTVVDLAAYPYQYSTSSYLKAVQTHLYDNVGFKSRFLNTWRSAYNVIASVNLALEELEKNGSVLSCDEEYRLFKGEFTGLRAYMHLELMRLCGLGDIGGENAGKLTIPYVTSFDKEPSRQHSYTETCALLMADIDTAVVCMAAADPVAGNVAESAVKSMNQDGYWTNRCKHLNYYAALALKARLLQWMGEIDSAAALADEVIEGALNSGLVSWVDLEALVGDQPYYAKDCNLSVEHIFSLEITDLPTLFILTNPVVSSSGYSINDSFIDDVLYVRVDPETGSLAGSEDIRGPLFDMSYSASGYYSLKLSATAAYSSLTDYHNRFAMIRLSEMYYLKAEKLIKDGDNAAALKVLDEVRRHRGVTSDFPATADADKELEKEYYREFINDGQLIYLLKHRGVKSSLNPSFEVSASALIFPYPDEEINYGRVQEL